MRTIPANQFAIVKDVQRNLVVGSGTFTECEDQAILFNHVYQTDAYVAKLWEGGLHGGR